MHAEPPAPSIRFPTPSASVPRRSRLLADIGGTHIRLAWQEAPQGPLRDTRVLPSADFATLQDALAAYLRDGAIPPLREAAFGIANPVTGDAIRMTNHRWHFSQNAVRDAFGWERLLVLNDFTALALSLPLLGPQLLRQVGGTAPVPGAAMALLGPGTGLGVSGLVFPPGRAEGVPLAGEGGHVTLSAHTPREAQVLACLRARYGHASAERALSGPGLVNLYHAVCQLAPPVARDVRGVQGVSEADRGLQVTTAAQVSALALQHQDAQALEAMELFACFLGSVAGNLALTLGARGGVFIGGGMVPRWGAWLDQSPFRARMQAKGRFEAYLSSIPCYVIDASATPALYGAARALDMA